MLSNSSVIPKTVEIFPSIPAKPRLPNTETSLRDLAKASMSRTGLDDPTNKALLSGSDSQITLIASCSDQSKFSNLVAAAVDALCQIL